MSDHDIDTVLSEYNSQTKEPKYSGRYQTLSQRGQKKGKPQKVISIKQSMKAVSPVSLAKGIQNKSNNNTPPRTAGF